MILKQASMEETAQFAGRIVAALEQPFDIDGNAVRIGASVGFALACEAGLDSDRLLAAADAARYCAGREGGRRVVAAAPSRPTLRSAVVR